MNVLRRNLVAFLLIFCAASTVKAAPADDQAIQKTLKTLINAIRYEKYDVAAKLISFSDMSSKLFANSWKSASASEQQEIISGVEQLIRGISFPRGHEMFDHLDAILYEPARVTGGTAQCKATVVVHRNYKKTEIVIDWVLVKNAAGWQVSDTIMLGESTAQSIHEDEVEPLLKSGGVPKVLQAMRQKIAEIKKK